MKVLLMMKKYIKIIIQLSILGILPFLISDWLTLKADKEVLDRKIDMISTHSNSIDKSQNITAEAIQEIEKNSLRLVAWALKERKLDILKIKPEDHLLAKDVIENEYSDAKFDKINDSELSEILIKMENTENKMANNVMNLLGVSQTLEAGTKLTRSIPTIMPVNGWLSSTFGYRKSPFNGKKTRHTGVDIAANVGTVVYATADGVVTKAGYKGGYGRLVQINHGFGISTRYGHNGKIFVKEGQKVVRGQKLSEIGMTGRTTGPHVHYEVLISGKQVNPRRFIKEGFPSEKMLAKAASAANTSLDKIKTNENQIAIGGEDIEIPRKIKKSQPYTAFSYLKHKAIGDKTLLEVSRSNLKYLFGMLMIVFLFAGYVFYKIFLKSTGLNMFYTFDGILSLKKKFEPKVDEDVADFWKEAPDCVLSLDDYRTEERKVS